MTKQKLYSAFAALALVASVPLLAQSPVLAHSGVIKGDKLGQVRAARHHIEQADENLEKAGDEFGGHRAKARELLRQAKIELDEAAKFAKSGH